jgi:hypothetical protein
MWLRFAAGLIYFALVAALLAGATDTSFLSVYPVLLAGVAAATAIGLLWLTLWARRHDSRPGQFQVGSLFFLTLEAGLLFAAIRWTAARFAQLHLRRSEQDFGFAFAAAFWLLVMPIGILVAIFMAEATIWAGVWLLKRPFARRTVQLAGETIRRLRWE